MKNLPYLISGTVISKPQIKAFATTTTLVKKSDGLINWHTSAEHIIRMERAYRPWPGIYTKWKNKIIKILEVKLHRPDQVCESPGKVEKVNDNIIVQTGKGSLIVCKLQLEGKSQVSGIDFISGYPDFINSKLQ